MAPIDDSDPDLPPRLQGDLRALFARRVEVPAEVDAALMAAARRQRLRPIRWWVAASTAAAAAAVVAFALLRDQPPATEPVLAREDFDGDGHVDVLDAYRLALALRAGQPVPVRFDLDGNGAVDRSDVDRIAMTAVAVRS
jgi:hypothetical protein